MATRVQQFELYAAEHDGVPQGRTFNTEDELKAYVRELRESWWWPHFYWRVRDVHVFRLPGGNKSVGTFFEEDWTGQIEMAPVHCTQLFVAHELAHVIADALYDSKSHDPAFARTYATLVYLTMGSTPWLALEAAFLKHKIEYQQR